MSATPPPPTGRPINLAPPPPSSRQSPLPLHARSRARARTQVDGVAQGCRPSQHWAEVADGDGPGLAAKLGAGPSPLLSSPPPPLSPSPYPSPSPRLACPPLPSPPSLPPSIAVCCDVRRMRSIRRHRRRTAQHARVLSGWPRARRTPWITPTVTRRSFSCPSDPPPPPPAFPPPLPPSAHTPHSHSVPPLTALLGHTLSHPETSGPAGMRVHARARADHTSSRRCVARGTQRLLGYPKYRLTPLGAWQAVSFARAVASASPFFWLFVCLVVCLFVCLPRLVGRSFVCFFGLLASSLVRSLVHLLATVSCWRVSVSRWCRAPRAATVRLRPQVCAALRRAVLPVRNGPSDRCVRARGLGVRAIPPSAALRPA